MRTITNSPPRPELRMQAASLSVPNGVRQVHLLTLAAAGVFLLYEFTRQWFVGEEWDYLAYRGVRWGQQGSPYSFPFRQEGLFYPHNEHWQTIPILIWRGLFNLVGVRYYWLYALPLIVAHLGIVHLLWRLMLRHKVEPWTATLLVAAFAVVGVGSENLVWAFQLGFVGSLAFGLLAVEAIEHDRIWLPPIWGTCALMCSGIGLPMVAGGGLVALARRRPRIAVSAVLPPVVIYLIWYVTVGHTATNNGGLSHLASLNFGVLVSYLWTGLTVSMGGFVDGSQHLGAVLVAVLAGAALVRRNVPAALAVTTVVLYVTIGLARSATYGAAQAATSHYSYITVALVLPLIGQLITILMRNRDFRPIVVSGLVLLIAVNAQVLYTRTTPFRSYAKFQERQVETAAYLIHKGERFPGQVTYSDYYGGSEGPGLAALTALVERGQVPVPTKVAPNILRAERAILGVYASPRRGYAGNLTFSLPGAPTCVRTSPRRSVVVSLNGSGSLRLRHPGDAYAVSFVHVPGAPSISSVVVTSKPGDRWLNVAAGAYSTAVITAYPAAVRLCEALTPEGSHGN